LLTNAVFAGDAKRQSITPLRRAVSAAVAV
jgi:hypothetical protein